VRKGYLQAKHRARDAVLLRRAGFSDAELEVQRSIYGSHLDVAQTRAASDSAWETESTGGAAIEFGAAVEYALADEL
jgi:hypothetical protein